MLIKFIGKLCLLSIMTYYCSAQRADVIADFDLTDIPTQWNFVKSEFDLGLFSFGSLHHYFKNNYDPVVKRIILMNPYVVWKEQDYALVPKEKLVLFSWEPAPINPALFRKVGRVYTYNDALVDGKHFFKLYYPFRMEMIANRPEFEQKKFCTMVTRDWTPERIKVVKFFDDKNGDFEFYGSNPGPFAGHKNYRGRIPGYHSGPEKREVLKKYRFCICFENTYHLPGYITEKIFSCFAAGCIPIYYGAPNVYSYIPKNCFIDYREFPNLTALYRFMKNMKKETYQQYIANIKAYLASKQSYLFSPEHFEEIVLDAIMQN